MQLSMFSLVTEAEIVYSKDKYIYITIPIYIARRVVAVNLLFQYIREGYLSRGEEDPSPLAECPIAYLHRENVFAQLSWCTVLRFPVFGVEKGVIFCSTLKKR